MDELTYTLTPAEAVTIDECLHYLKKLQLMNPTIAHEATYSADEIETVIATLTNQHSQIELATAYARTE